MTAAPATVAADKSRPRTIRIFAVLVASYALLSLPAWLGPESLQGISMVIYITPILAVYLFHHFGIPGLLQHGGACGWGWCSPTVLGWTVLVLFWIVVVWLAAWGIGWLVARWRTRRRSSAA